MSRKRMGKLWKFNGKELDPAKLPAMNDVVMFIMEIGAKDSNQDADREAIIHWKYEDYGDDVAYWYSPDPANHNGCVLVPVREGILFVPYGKFYPWDPDGIDLPNIGLISDEDCWWTVDECRMYGREKDAEIWQEAAIINGEMGIHDDDEDEGE